MGRVSRWGNLGTSTLVEDFGRPSVQVTATARAQAKQGAAVTKDFFVEKDAANFDLGPDTLRTMTDSGWAHPSPSANKMVGACWAAWSATNGDIAKASKTWLSLLASPGTLLRHDESKVRGIVIGTTQWGIFLQPASIHKTRGHIYLLVNGSEPTKFLPIFDFDGWRAVKPTVLSAAGVANLIGDCSAEAGVVFMQNGRGSKLQVHAAREGFKLLTKSFLDKLIRHEKLRFSQGAQPKTVDDCVKALIRHWVPDATDDFIARALEHRCGKHIDQHLANQSVLALDSNLDAMMHLMEADDHEALKEAVDKAKKNMSEDDLNPKSGGERRPAWTARPVDLSLCATLDQGRKLLPCVRGAWLGLDQKRFTRWTATYPNRLPPFYVTKSYGPKTGLTIEQALVHCLKQVWAWHEDLTGYECPYLWPQDEFAEDG
ncbi:unnamed protein product [Prorocentrum cordatum]|uniref:Uncharacterized protein n=1 Tax=Prorocentrum cordatum TaxID=2364126 RepID=A0ABN9V2Z4_9DINO|nr:unnamed protein product [Polarella glacialis]